MNENLLTEMQAFEAMFSFLESYYELTGSDEIGGLLGSMSLLQDETTADPAIMEEWKEAVEKVRKGNVNVLLSIQTK